MKKIACSALVSLFGSYSSATLRRPLCAISRSGYISANIAEAQQSATAGTAAALLACGRRGRWRTALDLLTQLENAPSGATAGAYRSALLACRKHKRHKEAADVLQRMGEHADTQAYNEVLHLLRLNGDFAGAEALWARMADANLHRDNLSYYHLLHICGELGRRREALELLEQMKASLGNDAVHSGHLLAVMRACVRDKRWAEAVELARAAPAEIIAGDAWLGRICLQAAAEAGEPSLATRLVADLGGMASEEQHAQSLVACRRAMDLPAARKAWAALEASDHATPDELCFAVMIGALLDAAARESVSSKQQAAAAAAAAHTSLPRLWRRRSYSATARLPSSRPRRPQSL